MINLDDNQTFYYKVVAKLESKYYSIYDGKTEFLLGQILYQKAEPNHKVINSLDINKIVKSFQKRVDFMYIVLPKKPYILICNEKNIKKTKILCKI